MIIISDYTLSSRRILVFFVESSENSYLCPVCQGMLRYRDSRPRIRKKEGGTKERLMIRRFRCQDCHSYHNELPDCLVPYKHYEAEVIAGVLDEVILQPTWILRIIRPSTPCSAGFNGFMKTCSA